jgi:hypothetical protein
MANRRSDDGSILLWVVGCVGVALLVAVAATQVVTVMHENRALQFATDKAILAAANRLELSRFRLTGVISDIDVSRIAGLQAVTQSLAGESFDARIETFVVTNRVVQLRTSRVIESPFGWGLAPGRRIYAEAAVSVTRMP